MIMASYQLLVSPQLHATTVVLYHRPCPLCTSPLHYEYPHHCLHHPLLLLTEDSQLFSREGMMHTVHI